MTDWFTSDSHFYHDRIINYCGRPFGGVEEMNEEMVQRWNERVQPGDNVYHLGDFAFGPRENVANVTKRLNGRLILIAGNHDRSHIQMLAGGFSAYYNTMYVRARPPDGPPTFVFLKHIPDFTGDWERKGSAMYHLCGHVHGAWSRKGNIINVGVDVSDFRPMTLPELLARD
jgi:calcineurin-like phosphoesterase family protein